MVLGFSIENYSLVSMKTKYKENSVLEKNYVHILWLASPFMKDKKFCNMYLTTYIVVPQNFQQTKHHFQLEFYMKTHQILKMLVARIFLDKSVN